MKNIFYILLLLPTIIFAQYPTNGNQKITLGEQTTADGLIYRGLAADTTRKPSIDTMAYMVLDTTTNIMWHYKKATSNAWVKIGGTTVSGTSGQVAYFDAATSVTGDAGLIYSAANKTLAINSPTTSGANLIIKNSQEPARTTFLASQTFGADTTNWTRGTGWTFNGTVAVATAATGDLTYTPSLTVTSGNAYEITYTLTGYTAGTLTVAFGNVSLALPTQNATANVILLLPTIATGGFRFTTSSFTGNLDDITVVQISNPAPVLFAGQDDGSATLYSSLRMPNSTTFAFGGGAIYTTGSNNAAIGVNALRANTTGSNNVANGQSALQNNTKGISNVANGVSALRANTTGSNNVANGAGALLNNTTGDGNVANGQSALQNNTTGSENIANGVNALLNNTTGNLNVANGSSALRNNTTGSKNVANGVSALRGNTTGSNNIATGESALYNPSESLTGSDNIAIGAFAADNIRSTATRNVVIGSYLDLPVQDGSYQGVYQNALFITGASGTGTTIAGNVGIAVNTPTARLHLVAGTATASTAPLKFTSGVNLTTAELGAMEFSLFNGANRLFITPESGVRKEIGYADLSNVSGTLPVANGGTNRTTMPAGYILHGDGTSVDTAIGLFYDRSNRWLGLGLNNPEYNLHLKNSLPIQIFLEGTSTSTHAAMYFTNSRSTDFTSYGGFLYGGTNQTQPLFGLNRNDKLFLFSDGSNNLGMIVGTLSNQPLYFGTNNTERMRIASGGAVTINNLAGINDVGADANGKLQAATSDINLKNTIENSPFGLNEILLLSPVTFLYNDTDRKIDSNVKEVGFIAQDVFDIIPNAVSSTGTGDLQLDYRAITATLVKAIQEQQALIKALEQRIINLENK